MNFAKTLAVISGGASGLGRAVAERVVAEGGRAAILDLQEAVGAQVAQEIGATYFKCDVSVEADVAAAFAAAGKELGGLNLLVNCAGIVGAGKLVGKEGPMSSAFFDKVMKVNLLGTFHCDKTAAAVMQANTLNDDGERGVIIHTASVASFGVSQWISDVRARRGYARATLALAAKNARILWVLLTKGDRFASAPA
jgi:NAD(P)-dependent dehydrogenase (short-subunit alcohol dehydrogenase family)